MRPYNLQFDVISLSDKFDSRARIDLPLCGLSLAIERGQAGLEPCVSTVLSSALMSWGICG